MVKYFVQDDNDVLRPLLGDDGGQAIVRPDHDEKILSFHSIVIEQITELNLPAGASNHFGTIVPAGEIWNITQASIQYNGAVATQANIMSNISGVGLGLLTVLNPITNTQYPVTVDIWMQAGDKMRFLISGAALNDDLYCKYNGYRMKAP